MSLGYIAGYTWGIVIYFVPELLKAILLWLGLLVYTLLIHPFIIVRAAWRAFTFKPVPKIPHLKLRDGCACDICKAPLN